MSITDEFLAHETRETSKKDALERHTSYRAFWKGYLEGTFSAALVTWYGMWRLEGGEKEYPLFVAECEQHDGVPRSDLLFDLTVHSPVYNETFMGLWRELFCPYLRDEKAHMAARASEVVEGFVRELAEAQPSPKEDFAEALAWLAQHVESAAKGAVEYLQETRAELRTKLCNTDKEPTEGQARMIVRSTSGAVLMACRDIRLDNKTKLELRSVLLREELV